MSNIESHTAKDANGVDEILTQMDLGVLRMPMDLAMGTSLAQAQYYVRVQELLDRIEAYIQRDRQGKPWQWTGRESVRLGSSRVGRVYLAGPMTGLPEFNFPAFNSEADLLRSQGFVVINPADHGIVDGALRQDYLRHDLVGIASCERIHFLKGWSQSDGALFELSVAQMMGLRITFQEGAESQLSDSDDRANGSNGVCPTPQGCDQNGCHGACLSMCESCEQCGSGKTQGASDVGFSVVVDVMRRTAMARAVFDAIRAETETLGPWKAFDADSVQRIVDALKPFSSNQVDAAISLPTRAEPEESGDAVDWRELSRRLYVELFHCDQQMTQSNMVRKRPIFTQGATVRDVLRDAKTALEITQHAPALACAVVNTHLTRSAVPDERDKCLFIASSEPTKLKIDAAIVEAKGKEGAA